MKKHKVLTVFTILSVVPILISFFWLPVFLSLKIDVPYFLAFFNLGFVALSAVPLVICTYLWQKTYFKDDNQKNENKIK